MKKILLTLLFISTLSFSSFLDGIQQIDNFMQKSDYENAYKVSQSLLEEDLTEDDKMVLLSIIKEIESKLPTIPSLNGIVKLADNTEIDEEAIAVSPVISQENNSKFNEYKEYEKKVLETKNSKVINDFAKFYIRAGLLEKAMNVALKDPNKEPYNLYLAATAARMLGEYDKSIALYQQVLSKDSSSYKSYLGLGINYKLKGDNFRAVKYLKKYASFVNSPEIQKEINILKALE